MSHFIFKAKRATGETYAGERDAADRYELYRLIRENGEEIVEVKELGSARSGRKMSFSLFGRIKMMEKINFARNLGSMLEAGLSLARALSVLERQSHNKAFKTLLTSLIGDISAGLTLSDAMKKHPKVFSQLFVSMVMAGEQSGTLADSFKVIANQMEKTHTLERKVKGALIYPGVILSAMVIIAVLMFVFVVPTLMKTFTELNVQLPLATRIVLGISNIFQNYSLVVLPLLILAGLGFRWWAKSERGTYMLHNAILRIPVIGGLIQEVNTARTARTISSLIDSGVDIVEAMSITADVVQNVHFRAVLHTASESIKKGGLMSDVFAKADRLYPVFLAEMMSVGEETGKTGEMLAGVARYYEDDVEQKTKDMSTVIEPFLMIIIASAVGFFAVAMISPMYALVDAI